MDAVLRLTLLTLFAALLLWTVIGWVKSVRRMLRPSQTERLGTVAWLVIVGVTIPSCVLVEHLTGLSPAAQPPSYAIRFWIASPPLRRW